MPQPGGLGEEEAQELLSTLSELADGLTGEPLCFELIEAARADFRIPWKVQSDCGHRRLLEHLD